MVIILLYFDDIIYGLEIILLLPLFSTVLSALAKEFDLKNLGELHCVFNIYLQDYLSLSVSMLETFLQR